jgi:nicotinamidase-related amidase
MSNRLSGPGTASWKALVNVLPDFEVDPRRTGLVIIDMTKQQASREHGFCRRLVERGFEADLSYYLDRIQNTVVPAIQRLTATFHEVGAPVTYTRCVSLRGDGSDQTWRHRHIGVVTTLDAEISQFLPGLEPIEGDIVLNKTGSSVFNSTNYEHLLRNMGITTVVVSGIYTNSCVEGTIRDAGDLDFRVLMAEDACAAMSSVGHENSIDYLDGNFCHAKSSAEIVELMRAGAQAGAKERPREHVPA